MKIISPFRDYYDGASGWYEDSPSVRYLRMPMYHENDELTYNTYNELTRGVFREHTMPLKSLARPVVRPPAPSWMCSVSLVLVGFCGLIYPGIKVTTPEVSTTLYAVNGFKGIDVALKRLPADMYTSLNKLNTRYRRWTRSPVTSDIQALVDKCCALTALERPAMFISMGVPVFTITRVIHAYCQGPTHAGVIIQLEMNSKLSDFNFGSVVSAPSAYQEIEMMLGGVFVQPDKAMVNISDADRIEQHGFNKFSFRHPVRLKDLK